MQRASISSASNIFVGWIKIHCIHFPYLGVIFFPFQSCANCDGEIEAGDMAVFAKKVADDICWHPACFNCHDCEELLIDLTYCHKDGNIFCERHYAELIRPRCAACDEVSTCRICDIAPASLTCSVPVGILKLQLHFLT